MTSGEKTAAITTTNLENAKSLRKKVIADTIKKDRKLAFRVRLKEILYLSYKLKKYQAPINMILVIIFILIYLFKKSDNRNCDLYSNLK